MSTPTKDDLRHQLHHAKAQVYAGRTLYDILHDQAQAHGWLCP